MSRNRIDADEFRGETSQQSRYAGDVNHVSHPPYKSLITLSKQGIKMHLKTIKKLFIAVSALSLVSTQAVYAEDNSDN